MNALGSLLYNELVLDLATFEKLELGWWRIDICCLHSLCLNILDKMVIWDDFVSHSVS